MGEQMEAREHESIEHPNGRMNQKKHPCPGAFERAQHTFAAFTYKFA
jgi:hypothetical protein